MLREKSPSSGADAVETGGSVCASLGGYGGQTATAAAAKVLSWANISLALFQHRFYKSQVVCVGVCVSDRSAPTGAF